MDPIKLTFRSNPPKKLRTVYIIEDSQIELSMVLDYFEKYPGIKVKGFSTGENCIKEIVVSGISPDMILVDYFLDSSVSTSKDGLEILTKLRELSPDSTIIMHTSIENEKIVDLAKRKGAANYIVKGPAGFEKLDTIIESQFVLDV